MAIWLPIDDEGVDVAVVLSWVIALLGIVIFLDFSSFFPALCRGEGD